VVLDEQLIEVNIGLLQVDEQAVVFVSVVLHALVPLLKVSVFLSELFGRVDDFDFHAFSQLSMTSEVRAKSGVIVQLPFESVGSGGTMTRLHRKVVLLSPRYCGIGVFQLPLVLSRFPPGLFCPVSGTFEQPDFLKLGPYMGLARVFRLGRHLKLGLLNPRRLFERRFGSESVAVWDGVALRRLHRLRCQIRNSGDDVPTTNCALQSSLEVTDRALVQVILLRQD